jgi:hypothetical protein
MADARALLTADRARVLEAVPSADQAAAAVLADKLTAKLESVSAAIAAQDADVTATRLAAAFDLLGQLELLQSPGLAYLLPAAYADRPRLLGRATAEFVIQRGGGGTFAALSDGRGPQRTAKVVVTLDGYNAPLTAGNAAQLIDRARTRDPHPRCTRRGGLELFFISSLLLSKQLRRVQRRVQLRVA